MQAEPQEDGPKGLPDAYRKWRASRLGGITDALEEELILDVVGPPSGLRVLDAGCGDAGLAVALAQRGADVTGLDVDPRMLASGRARAFASGVAVQLVRGDIRALPFSDRSFDVVRPSRCSASWTMRRARGRSWRAFSAPGGRLVIGELGRCSLWAAKRRVSGWLGSRTWRPARFRTARWLTRLVAGTGLEVTGVRGAIYYPPFGAAAALLARLDAWIGKRTTAGAAFIVIVGRKPA
jgi:SAM-dependent methyltransferase